LQGIAIEMQGIQGRESFTQVVVASTTEIRQVFQPGVVEVNTRDVFTNERRQIRDSRIPSVEVADITQPCKRGNVLYRVTANVQVRQRGQCLNTFQGTNPALRAVEVSYFPNAGPAVIRRMLI